MTPTSPTSARLLTRRPQTVAWTILLLSFAVFCSACAVGTFGAYWFLFESQVELKISLTVSKGRVDIAWPDGTNRRANSQEYLPASVSLQTDGSSQGYLTFEDSYSKQVVATVFLLGDSTLSLASSARPRFEWSRNAYFIALDEAAGHFFVRIQPQLNRPITLSVGGGPGEARFTEGGAFSIDTTDQQTTVQAHSGPASLRPAGQATATRVEAGMRATALKSQPQVVARPVTTVRLNADFGDSDVEKNRALPLGWACASQADQQNEPQGAWARALVEQRVVLRMTRAGEGLDHAETRCEFNFEQVPTVGLDMAQFVSLSIRAEMRIQVQDVTTCGIRGSECPIMLELAYLGEGGIQHFWRHGFYARRPLNDNNPTLCDTCLQEHDKLTPDAWFIFESGDLLRLLPENRRPLALTHLKVYASGHAYDVTVSDLTVLGGTEGPN